MKSEKLDSDENDDEDMEETLEDRTSSTNISVSLPRRLIKKVEDYGERHKLKRSQVVARALEGLGEREERIFKKLDRIEAIVKNIPKQTTSKSALKEDAESQKETERVKTLINDCITFFDGFEIEGEWEEEGFKTLCQKRGLVGDELWINERLDMLVPYLKIGYEGYFSKPDRDDWLEKIADAMQIEKQRPVLIEKFNELYGEEEETEEEEW